MQRKPACGLAPYADGANILWRMAEVKAGIVPAQGA